MRLTLPISALVTLAPGLLGAQQSDSIKVDSTHLARAYRVEGVTVRVARPGLTTGGSSAVSIELDSMSHIPSPTMEQVLRTMPLIQIRTNSRGEAQPALRGSEDRQIAVLVDGVPLTLGWDHRTDLSIIPLTAARSVTLLRGLSSVLYGPNTLGGVVEVDVARTKRRVDRVQPFSLGFSLDETGGTNVSATGGGLVDGTYSQWVLRTGLGFQDRPGVPLPAGAADDGAIRSRYLGDEDLRLNSDARRVDGFLSARYVNDNGRWLSMSASAYDVERGVPPEAHQDEPRLWRYPDQRRLLAAITGGTGQRRTPWGTGDMETSVGIDLGHTRIDQFATRDYDRVVEREEADDRTLTFRLLGDHTLGPSGELRAALTYADIAHDEVLTPGGPNDYRQRLWSVGVESEWLVGGGDATRFTLGAALDRAGTPESGDKPPLEPLTDYGFRVGLSSLVSDGLLLHGGVSRRARFPSLRELYSGALGRFDPNPNLRPETLLGTEAGFTVQKGDGEFQAVLFHHRLADGIVRTSVTTPQGDTKFRRVNRDEIRSTGLELLGVAGVGNVTLSGDFTLQDVQGITGDGSDVEVEYEPAILGKLGVEVPLPRGVRAGTNFRFVGSQKCENPELGGLQPLDASKTLDLSLRRVFTRGRGGPMRNVDASLSIQNVTDSVVYDQCGLLRPGRTFQIQFRLF